MTIGSIFVLVIVIAIVALIIWSMVRDHTQGKHSCGGTCGGCPNAASCHGTAGCHGAAKQRKTKSS